MTLRPQAPFWGLPAPAPCQAARPQEHAVGHQIGQSASKGGSASQSIIAPFRRVVSVPDHRQSGASIQEDGSVPTHRAHPDSRAEPVSHDEDAASLGSMGASTGPIDDDHNHVMSTDEKVDEAEWEASPASDPPSFWAGPDRLPVDQDDSRIGNGTSNP